MTSYYPYDDPYAGYAPPPPDKRRSPKRGRVLGAGIAGLVAGAVVAGLVLANVGSGSTVAGSGSVSQLAPTNPGSGGTSGNGSSGNGSSNPGQLIPGSINGGNAASSASLATTSQKRGIVTIVSVLSYQNAESAGTGLILTSDGEILTNNHVIEGATSITVRVASTDKTYRADVVGTDPTDDVAVLQLRDASGLTTANLASSSSAGVGDTVVGVGNAGGTGTLRASSGKITALGRSITASDGNGQDAERLTGLIEVNAPIISGDSGGPLYNSADEVIGMDTAASQNRSASETAYAIPITSAVKIANQIESGIETSKIHIGLPAFLGVSLDPQITSSATVDTLLPGGAAAGAGIPKRSVITGVDSTQVTTAASLKAALQKHQPGDKVSIHWRDASGNAHTTTVTLAAGPAD
jgi:S1-C subfamily serine protease